MKRAGVLIMVFLLSFLMNGCGAKAPKAETTATPVEVVKVTKADLQMDYSTSGKIEGSAEAAIASKVSGRVSSVRVKMGDHVRKGQVLFTLDARDARNDLASSNASLGVAQAGYDTAAQAVKDAKNSYNRNKALYESKIISQSDWEKEESNLVTAQLKLKQAQKQLEQARTTVSSSQSDLGDYSVISPINGLVGDMDIEVGEMVSPQAQVGTVVNLDTVKVTASVPESIVNRLEPGTKVPVTIDSLDKSVEGTVASIAPVADSTTMGYKVEVEVANSSGNIKPGMTAKVDFSTGVMKNIIALPVDAVIEKDGQNLVFIVENNKAKEVYVEVGVSNDAQVQITKGLKVNELVITEGNTLLSDGQLVKVVGGKEGTSKAGNVKGGSSKAGDSK